MPQTYNNNKMASNNSQVAVKDSNWELEVQSHPIKEQIMLQIHNRNQREADAAAVDVQAD